jgi:hypothetical protein
VTSWTTPKTWVSGSALTAAEMNEQVRDNTLHLYERVVGYAPTKSADQNIASTTYANVTDLSFPVTNGTNYTVLGVLKWSHSTAGAGDGPGIAYDHPGGGTTFLLEYTGAGSATGVFRDSQSSVDSAVVSQNDSAGANRLCRIMGTYACTGSGTFQIRFKRFSAGTLTIYKGSSLFVTSD